MPKEEGQNENMTLDTLAQMTQREFVGVQKKIDGLKEDMDGRFDAMDNKFDVLAQILNEIRKDNKEIKEGVMTINLDYVELRTRIERLEKKVGLREQHQVS